MPVTPYNTGKVKIGIHYVPPQQNFNTETTDHWQNVFLGDHAYERRASIRFWIGCCFVAAVCFALFAFREVITI